MDTLIENIRQKKTGLGNKFVEFIEDELNEESSDEKIQFVSKALESANLLVLVEEIKTAIHQLIYQAGINSNRDIPDYISEKVKYNYIFLNKLFIQHTGSSIKKYINAQKIELIKELLCYNDLNFTQIASKLNYRNTAHLTEEFRKETGVSLAFYRLLRKPDSDTIQNV
jgi:AraC-like DNA-binding protein